jgi:hypothetical protein
MGMLMARKLAQRGWRVFAGVMQGSIPASSRMA